MRNLVHAMPGPPSPGQPSESGTGDIGKRLGPYLGAQGEQLSIKHSRADLTPSTIRWSSRMPFSA